VYAIREEKIEVVSELDLVDLIRYTSSIVGETYGGGGNQESPSARR